MGTDRERSSGIWRRIAVYFLTLVFSVAYIVVGRHYAMTDYPEFSQSGEESFRAEVTSIISDEEIENGRILTFLAELQSGEDKDKIIQVTQSIYTNTYPVQSPVEVGDKIVIFRSAADETQQWKMTEFCRSDYILYLGALFCLAVLIFGRMKGINTLISLGFTCLSVFYVFLPSIMSGKNIYLWSIISCLYMIVMTMLFINGACKKSLVAGLGCFSGVVMSGLITVVMNRVTDLTGMTSEDTLYLQMINTASPIDLRGVVFAAIIIGAVGAIMDVAMDISSSLNEMKENIPEADARLLIRSGFNIGRDIMGTMANTLVLAYIGSSLTTTVLLMAYNITTLELFNMELIVVELLQALAGSIGMLLAIPLTTFISAAIYTRHVEAAPKRQKKQRKSKNTAGIADPVDALSAAVAAAAAAADEDDFLSDIDGVAPSASTLGQPGTAVLDVAAAAALLAEKKAAEEKTRQPQKRGRRGREVELTTTFTTYSNRDAHR